MVSILRNSLPDRFSIDKLSRRASLVSLSLDRAQSGDDGKHSSQCAPEDELTCTDDVTVTMRHPPARQFPAMQRQSDE